MTEHCLARLHFSTAGEGDSFNPSCEIKQVYPATWCGNRISLLFQNTWHVAPGYLNWRFELTTASQYSSNKQVHSTESSNSFLQVLSIAQQKIQRKIVRDTKRHSRIQSCHLLPAILPHSFDNIFAGFRWAVIVWLLLIPPSLSPCPLSSSCSYLTYARNGCHLRKLCWLFFLSLLELNKTNVRTWPSENLHCHQNLGRRQKA